MAANDAAPAASPAAAAAAAPVAAQAKQPEPAAAAAAAAAPQAAGAGAGAGASGVPSSAPPAAAGAGAAASAAAGAGGAGGEAVPLWKQPLPHIAVAADVLALKFQKPVKCIASEADVPRLLESKGGVEVMGLIMSVNAQLKGKSMAHRRVPSPAVNAIVSFLTDAKRWVSEIPPVKQAQRFGNTAFRTWVKRLHAEAELFHAALLPDALKAAGAAVELQQYMAESFGNSQRIDYGSGHELNFVCWLAALNRVGVLTASDHLCVGFDVFPAYLDATRQLQSVYWLEPAGSKGVWGLDDYSFLPFLWGSAQLMGQDDIAPSQLSTEGVCSAAYTRDYLFFAAVAFVRRMKSGPFHEHSPLLDSIGQVPAWSKVNAGLIKMYQKEVWSKFPIVQHFYFGAVLPFERAPPRYGGGNAITTTAAPAAAGAGAAAGGAAAGGAAAAARPKAPAPKPKIVP